mmetsp:Transcript_5689/g.13146  ORF Transcript_5689/g.13146 Transcript_5689/m.13146 type:complete len:232 (+) Transcript_5689:1835-2530(+)
METRGSSGCGRRREKRPVIRGVAVGKSFEKIGGPRSSLQIIFLRTPFVRDQPPGRKDRGGWVCQAFNNACLPSSVRCLWWRQQGDKPPSARGRNETSYRVDTICVGVFAAGLPAGSNAWVGVRRLFWFPGYSVSEQECCAFLLTVCGSSLWACCIRIVSNPRFGWFRIRSNGLCREGAVPPTVSIFRLRSSDEIDAVSRNGATTIGEKWSDAPAVSLCSQIELLFWLLNKI